MITSVGSKVENLEKILSRKLSIPEYQRSYSWTVENVFQLLEDLQENYEIKKNKKNGEASYRLGSIILHKQPNEKYHIVDGQQRLVTLTMLFHCLDPNSKISLLESEFTIEENKNIQRNLKIIKTFTSENLPREEDKNDYIKFLKNNIEMLLIEIEKDYLQTAYQLFDSQNARGLSLNGTDILKAYHLRACHLSNDNELAKIVKNWEDLENKPDESEYFRGRDTRNTLDKTLNLLYKTRRWTKNLSVDDYNINSIKCRDSVINEFKGIILENGEYNYKKFIPNAEAGRHQISEPIINGERFFNYIFFYHNEINKMEEKLRELFSKEPFKGDKKFLGDFNRSGDSYIRDAYQVLLLKIWDRYDSNALEKLNIHIYKWIYQLRLINNRISYFTVNKYMQEGRHLIDFEYALFPPDYRKFQIENKAGNEFIRGTEKIKEIIYGK